MFCEALKVCPAGREYGCDTYPASTHTILGYCMGGREGGEKGKGRGERRGRGGGREGVEKEKGEKGKGRRRERIGNNKSWK